MDLGVNSWRLWRENGTNKAALDRAQDFWYCFYKSGVTRDAYDRFEKVYGSGV